MADLINGNELFSSKMLSLTSLVKSENSAISKIISSSENIGCNNFTSYSSPSSSCI
jgi:hypothetical protein